MKKAIFGILPILVFTLVIWLGARALAEDYPQGCTEPNGHAGQEEPHQQTNEGHQQCHAASGMSGSCSFINGFDSAEVNCNVTTFTGTKISTCTVTLECAGEDPKSCVAVASGNGNLSALIGKNNQSSEVYGHCQSSTVDTLLTCS